MKKIISIISILAIMVQLCSCNLDVSELMRMDVADIANSALETVTEVKRYEKKIGDEKIDYEKMIGGFEESPLNVFELTVGECDVPGASIWIEENGGSTYSSDEGVVAVNKYGKVTAIGRGEAYVVIVSPISDSMYEVYKYVVYGEVPEADHSHLPEIPGIDFAGEIRSFEEDPLNTKELRMEQADSPTAAIWAKNGGKCYTSDPDVVTVDSNGTVSAEGEGTAYVVITSGVGNMFQIYKYKVKC